MHVYAILAVLAVPILAGCTDPVDNGPQFVIPEQDSAGRYVIEMTSALTFEPKLAQVPAGATVVWVFKGGGAHDAEAEDGTFKSPLLRNEGEEFEHTFTSTGEFDYWCNPHRSTGMLGTIRVG